MALDEALLRQGAHPTLRFYTWSPTALSLGFFQKLDDIPQARAVPVAVRRLTGGGAIHHTAELTFSITTSVDHPLYRGEVRASYERVHAILADALRGLGVEARLRGPGPAASDRPGPMCFHRSTPLDLVWGGRKGVGTAQRRSGGRVLHHGSIKLGPNELEPGIATFHEAGGVPGPAELADCIAGSFERALGCRVVVGEPGGSEQRAAANRAAFFRSTAFLKDRRALHGGLPRQDSNLE